MSLRSRTLLVALLALSLTPSAATAKSQQGAGFDGEATLAHAAAMVAMGPRPLGSEALEANRVYIEEHLRGLGLEPRRQEFDAATPVGVVPMANIIAEIPAADGGDGPLLLLSGHYDTKLFEGVDFVGANDGASSASILLQLANHLVAEPLAVPVWLVFFDGEEAVVRWAGDDNTYGSRHMVSELQASGEIGRIGALVLFDMVGDADLAIPREVNSTPWLMDVIWGAAREAGHGDAFPESVHAILDDHLPFVDAGVDAVDLIDFDYGPGNRYWHSPFDTLDKLSAESFRKVGETMLVALPRIARLLHERAGR